MIPADPIRIMVVDDHPMIREGVGSMVGSEPGMKLAAEASDGVEAIELFRTCRPDVTLMDLEMPNMDGLSAITTILAEFPSARILVLTTFRGDARALRALQAGAGGYILKNRIRKELMDAIRQVHAGRKYVDAEVAAQICESFTHDRLSPREVAVLQHVAEGASNKVVATAMKLSEETIKSHMKSVLTKLNANDRTHAVVIALDRGIIERLPQR
ncbi:MAG TPA: response regulator transcription factor [Steroidobacter sp.]|uniref:response regulator transcription factor n=1 Tax=Steroidobacter sp. TaxID=1978227 RepID=UPI002EDB9E00